MSLVTIFSAKINNNISKFETEAVDSNELPNNNIGFLYLNRFVATNKAICKWNFDEMNACLGAHKLQTGFLSIDFFIYFWLLFYYVLLLLNAAPLRIFSHSGCEIILNNFEFCELAVNFLSNWFFSLHTRAFL